MLLHEAFLNERDVVLQVFNPHLDLGSELLTGLVLLLLGRLALLLVDALTCLPHQLLNGPVISERIALRVFVLNHECVAQGHHTNLLIILFYHR